jgi:hypothetical protein
MIQQIAITSLFITGVHILFWEGGILGWLGIIWETFLPEWVCNPVFNCLKCMASVWGTLAWFGYWHGGFNFSFPVFILAVAGLNTIIDGVISFCERVILHHE